MSMKLRLASFAGLLVGVGLLGQLATVHAQTAPPTTTYHVLDLDGNGSYVELPGNLFTNEVVTVEGWIKWREFGSHSRFFEFDDAALQVAVMNFERTPGLELQRFRAPAFEDLRLSIVTNLLEAGKWCHVAMVAGANWSRLYVNGALMNTNDLSALW